jgi:hypothetical protein
LSRGEAFSGRLNGAADRLELSGAPGNNEIAGQMRMVSVALKGLPGLHNPHSSDIDEDAILTFAQTIGAQLPGDAGLATAAVAHAVRFHAF